MKVVILAGGGGTRLFPMSRVNYPKQFLNIDTDKSLLSETIYRYLGLVNPEDIIIVTSEKYYFYVKSELSKCAAEGANILVEPCARNTAPAIILAIKFITENLICESDEVVFIAPSDHIIKTKEEFQEILKKCLEASLIGKIVTLGIKPDKPETGYGYIEYGNSFQNGFEVKKFTEKPDKETAKEYLSKGNYFWNSGMYSFTIKSFYEELEKYEPEMLTSAIYNSFDNFFANFPKLKSISIDYAIAERSDRVVTIPLNIYWSDVGSWDSIYEFKEKDDKGNVKIGDCESIDCENSLLLSNERLITGIGLKDIIVVETDDVILVSKRGETQKVKKIVENIKERIEVRDHTICYRPWGTYKVISEDAGYKVKKISVKQNKELTMHLHKYRSEHWVVISGVAIVVINDGNKREIRKGESIFIPHNTKHKLINSGDELLEIIEVQNGDYLNEDDIVRDT